MSFGAVSLLIVAGCIATQAFRFDNALVGKVFDEEWQAFKLQYGKSYKNDIEESLRVKIWLEKRQKISQHNRELSSYKMGMNQFGDLTDSEAAAMFGSQNKREFLHPNSDSTSSYIPPANYEPPKSIDWRKLGAVTEVKTQGNCNSGWAMSAIGSLEGQHFRKAGSLVSLSEQNLVDCIKIFEGCKLGDPTYALMFIKNMNGVDTEKDYPYTGVQGSCAFSNDTIGATVTGVVAMEGGPESLLKYAVASVGPIVAAIQVDDSLMHYASGIYQGVECPAVAEPNHFVLIVGYGSENGKDYWIVKNSWGTTWGEEGYFRLSRNSDNNCGISSYNVVPLV